MQNVNDMNKEEKDILDNGYAKYQNMYNKLKKNIITNKCEYADFIHYNLYPCECERMGFKCGKLLKKAPTKSKHYMVYDFNDDKIVHISTFDNMELSSEQILIYEKKYIIQLRYGDAYSIENLNRIYISYLDDNRRPIYSLFLDIDDEERNYVKEEYLYSDGSITTILRKGFIIEDEKEHAVIDESYKVEYGDAQTIKKILATQINHKLNKVNHLIVYGK